ncbi:MAG: Acetoin:2,6-dichlorophenolindophenol oxidoreductase subunit alpha [Chlamydiales bacterium]|nr:Acetoin:2,6-dichlorophenolindophenol oxidoreductase subunit alpha [Chlamydiales bacterium]
MSNKSRKEAALKQIGKHKALEALKWMLLIRHFEVRGESAYQHGLVGGFFHSYAGQEAIQTAAAQVFGRNNWWIGFYRCHALALLLGATPNELMAELYGKATGNAKGRGGSMHLYTDRLLGGFGIVGGHLPLACGAAFSLKYLKKKDEVAVCFMGDGATAQGAFHESLNLASLWDLPVIFIIENNQWGMGTHAERALCYSDKIAELQGPSYKMKSYTLNGMDYFECYCEFEKIHKEVLKTSRPVLIECICERFRGHSISDPALYRSKENLQKIMKQDPIPYLHMALEEADMLSNDEFKELDKQAKDTVLAAMKFAEQSPFPSPATLEEDVYAP